MAFHPVLPDTHSHRAVLPPLWCGRRWRGPPSSPLHIPLCRDCDIQTPLRSQLCSSSQQDHRDVLMSPFASWQKPWTRTAFNGENQPHTGHFWGSLDRYSNQKMVSGLENEVLAKVFVLKPPWQMFGALSRTETMTTLL